MPRTQVNGTQVSDGSIGRADLNTTTAGSAVITKLIAGTGVTMTFTGADSGTGDVTINSSDAVSSVFGRTGAVVKAIGDYSFGDISGTLLAASFPALTGDVTSTAGSLATTLANVNANVGTFTSVTVNAKGLVTAATMVTNFIVTPLAATANGGYTDNTNYYGYATVANGFPIAGSFSGMRFGTTGTQKLQSEVVGSLWNRSWNNTLLAWSVWILLLDSHDYTSMGQISVSTGSNAYSVLASPTADGQVLTSLATNPNGMTWSAPASAVGGGANALGTYIVQMIANAPANAQALGSLTTGILKSTTTTGVVSIAVAADFPVLNQSTTGTASNITGVLTAASFPALTGDVTNAAGSLATTLANVNANVGTFTSVTVNAKGLVTAATMVTNFITTPLAGNANGTYTDNTNYYGYATVANGFPIAGSFSGMRFGTTGTQKLQSEVVGSLWNRSWNNAGNAWSVWVLLLDSHDYTGVGQISVSTGSNAYSVLASPTADGQVLTSLGTNPNGMTWATPAGGGGAITPATTTALGGIKLGNGFSLDVNNALVVAGTIISFGLNAAISTTTGTNNVAIGTDAGKLATNGGWNVYVGHLSGKSITGGYYNTFVGFNSGGSSANGYDNTYIGYQAGMNVASSNRVVAIGSEACQGGTGGSNAVFIGYKSGFVAGSSFGNCFLGDTTGVQTTGSYNTFVGTGAGAINTTGGNHVALGNDSGPSIANLSNTVSIGTGAKSGASSTAVFAASLSVGIGGQASATAKLAITDGNLEFKTTGTGIKFFDGTTITTAPGAAPATAPGGTTTQIQFNNAGAFAGAAFASITAAGHLNIAEITVTPAVPTSGVTVIMRKRADRRMMAQVGPSGLDYAFQPFLATNKISIWSHAGNSAVVTSPILTTMGIQTANVGTATARPVATTSFYHTTKRLGLVSATTAGANAEVYGTAAQWFRGSNTTPGGFYAVFRFGISDAVNITTARMFVGFTSAVAATGNVAITSLLNMVGVGCDSGDTVLSIYTNAGAGAATKVSLGNQYPVSDTVTWIYELRLFSGPNATTIGYSVARLETAALIEGTLTTNLPTALTLLSPHVLRSNGTGAGAVGLDILSFYIETDY